MSDIVIRTLEVTRNSLQARIEKLQVEEAEHVEALEKIREKLDDLTADQTAITEFTKAQVKGVKDK